MVKYVLTIKSKMDNILLKTNFLSEPEASIPPFHYFYPACPVKPEVCLTGVKLFSISLGSWKWHKPASIKRYLISTNCRISETLNYGTYW